jgi:hypothetical protein
MKHLIFAILACLGMWCPAQCTADYETIADSTVADVSFLQGLVDRWCFHDPCDSSIRYGEVTIRGRSGSFHNTIILHGFQGMLGMTVMDTTCGIAVFDTCYWDVGFHEEVTMTVGKNFVVGLTAHGQQIPTPQVYILSVPTADPPPYVNGCPVGVAEWQRPRPRRPSMHGYDDLLGRHWESPPERTVVRDNVNGRLIIRL